jgi:hypothetical protein
VQYCEEWPDLPFVDMRVCHLSTCCLLSHMWKGSAYFGFCLSISTFSCVCGDKVYVLQCCSAYIIFSCFIVRWWRLLDF